MSAFVPRVWAPRPESVRLWWAPPGTGAGFVGGATEPMSPDAGGWWTAQRELPVGARYGFLLSGPDAPEHPLPDPRGRRLPEGVHGPSEVQRVEERATPASRNPAHHDAHGFRDAASGGSSTRSLIGKVIYEAHVGTLTPDGTLDSAIRVLPHLVSLGVDAIELLPVNGFNGEWNWGYDGVAWFTVHEAYGGPDAYRRFVDAAHRAGLAVIQDVVYNHLGPSGNYLPLFGPYLRTGSRNTWGDSVNFDEPEVRSYVLDNARMWLEDYGVDGLRLDAVHALVDPDSPVHILRAIADQARELERALGRPLTLIAESDLNDPTMIETGDPTGGAEGHRGMDAQWSDDYHHAVHVALTGEISGYYADFASLDALGKVWAHGFFHDGTYSSFRGRNHGRPIPADIPPTRLVVFDQDHDQVGNRAAGDRLSATLSPARLTIAAVLAICNPNTPMLFMGEEWGASTPWAFFTSHPEPELGRIVAEGRLTEFEQVGWDPSLVPDPQDPETFFRSKLDWDELDAPAHRELFDVYRELIALRRRTPELGGSGFPELAADVDAEARTAALRAGDVMVYVNLGLGDWTVPVDEVLFVSSEDVSSPATGDLTLPPDSAVIGRYPRR